MMRRLRAHAEAVLRETSAFVNDDELPKQFKYDRLSIETSQPHDECIQGTIIAQMKAGKSLFANCFFLDGPNVVPSGVLPETSVAVKIDYFQCGPVGRDEVFLFTGQAPPRDSPLSEQRAKAKASGAAAVKAALSLLNTTHRDDHAQAPAHTVRAVNPFGYMPMCVSWRDTPGPNEALKPHIKKQTMDALRTSDFALFVMDATNFGTTDDAELLMDFQNTAPEVLENIAQRGAFIINKIDKYDGDPEELRHRVKTMVEKCLTIEGEKSYTVPLDRILFVSALEAFLGCAVRRKAEVCVTTLGKLMYGKSVPANFTPLLVDPADLLTSSGHGHVFKFLESSLALECPQSLLLHRSTRLINQMEKLLGTLVTKIAVLSMSRETLRDKSRQMRSTLLSMNTALKALSPEIERHENAGMAMIKDFVDRCSVALNKKASTYPTTNQSMSTHADAVKSAEKIATTIAAQMTSDILHEKNQFILKQRQQNCVLVAAISSKVSTLMAPLASLLGMPVSAICQSVDPTIDVGVTTPSVDVGTLTASIASSTSTSYSNTTAYRSVTTMVSVPVRQQVRHSRSRRCGSDDVWYEWETTYENQPQTSQVPYTVPVANTTSTYAVNSQALAQGVKAAMLKELSSIAASLTASVDNANNQIKQKVFNIAVGNVQRLAKQVETAASKSDSETGDVEVRRAKLEALQTAIKRELDGVDGLRSEAMLALKAMRARTAQTIPVKAQSCRVTVAVEEDEATPLCHSATLPPATLGIEGTVDVGKTTVVNVFLGAPVAPFSALPNTAGITRFVHSANMAPNQIKVSLGVTVTHALSDSLTGEGKLTDVATARITIEAFNDDLRSQPKKAVNVTSVVRMNSQPMQESFLGASVSASVVDFPGRNDAMVRSAALVDAIHACEKALTCTAYVVDATRVERSADEDGLRHCLRRCLAMCIAANTILPLVVVVNKIDAVEGHELRAEVLRRVYAFVMSVLRPLVPAARKPEEFFPATQVVMLSARRIAVSDAYRAGAMTNQLWRSLEVDAFGLQCRITTNPAEESSVMASTVAEYSREGAEQRRELFAAVQRCLPRS